MQCIENSHNKKDNKMTEEVKKDEDWMQKKWRPAMGWMYIDRKSTRLNSSH
jgi:hypothetical protein